MPVFHRFALGFTLAAGALLSSGCVKDHGIDPLPLRFVSFSDNPYRYDLRFQADEDLLSLFERHTGNGQISERLVCALDGDENFDLEHVITYNLSGSPEFESRAPDGSFNYLAQMSFDKTLPSRSSSTELTRETIQRLLENRTTIPCKLYITAFPYHAYFSLVMRIPVSALLAEVNKHDYSPYIPPFVWAAPTLDDATPLAPFARQVEAPLYSARLPITDSETGRPLPRVAYVIQRKDGYLEYGTSDAEGYTHEVISLTRETIKLYLVD